MTRRMIPVVGLLAGGLSIAAGAQEPPAPTAPQPAPVLRASVDHVVVDAVVTDASGAPVFGLTAADFEVLEGDRPQTIATFSEIALPAARPADAASAAPAPSDVRSNRQAGTGGVFLLLLDDLHVRITRTAAVRRETREFIRRYVQPGDSVAVFQTSGGGRGQDLTTDMALVEASIARFVGRGDPSPTMRRLEGRQPVPRLTADDEKRLIPGPPPTTLDQLRTATDPCRPSRTSRRCSRPRPAGARRCSISAKASPSRRRRTKARS